MFVKTLADLKARGQERVLCNGNIRTVRFLTRADGLGFTVSDVRVSAGIDQILWYRNHIEANFVVSGEGTVEDTNSGRSWKLEPGVIYVVGPKDRHRILSTTDMYIISVFNPPLTGNERHDADGTYEPGGEIPPGRDTMFVKHLDELRAAGREKVVAGGSARTIRALLQEDALGFTVCDVNLDAGQKNILWYKHHWEANYILGGRGEVVDLGTNASWVLEPGVMYMVGPDDRHSMRAHSDLHLVSIFNPALKGDEMHDAEGTIPPSGPTPPGPTAG